jgi:hypothetical protein
MWQPARIDDQTFKKGYFVRRFALSGLAMLTAIAGIVVPVAAGQASAAVTPSATRSFTGAAPFAASSNSTLSPYKISCGTATTCLAVATMFNNNTGNASPVALAWNGAKWRSVVLHSPKGTTLRELSGVSCKTASYCMVIGTDMVNATGVTRSFAVIWNGTAVTAAPQPPVPAGLDLVSINGVSCVAVKSCVVAGASMATGVSPVATGGKRFVETWNGAKWALHAQAAGNAVPLPLNTGLSCVSLSYCMLSGENLASNGSNSAPYLAAWNGKTITAMKVPVPAGFRSMLIYGLSCASTTSCAITAAGVVVAGKTSKELAFAETWNGKTWTAARLPWPASDLIALLESVSCTASKTAGPHCMAVGAAGTAGSAAPVAASWNGKAWSMRQLPGPGAGKVTVLEGVSCSSAKQCTAIGETGASNGNVLTTIAGFWNGSTWRLAAA